MEKYRLTPSMSLLEKNPQVQVEPCTTNVAYQNYGTANNFSSMFDDASFDVMQHLQLLTSNLCSFSILGGGQI